MGRVDGTQRQPGVRPAAGTRSPQRARPAPPVRAARQAVSPHARGTRRRAAAATEPTASTGTRANSRQPPRGGSSPAQEGPVTAAGTTDGLALLLDPLQQLARRDGDIQLHRLQPAGRCVRPVPRSARACRRPPPRRRRPPGGVRRRSSPSAPAAPGRRRAPPPPRGRRRRSRSYRYGCHRSRVVLPEAGTTRPDERAAGGDALLGQVVRHDDGRRPRRSTGSASLTS